MKKKWSARKSGGSNRTLPSTFSSSEDQSPWRRRFDSIHLALRERITTLEYAPGVRLDVDALSAEFGVSRTPVRNVLQRLGLEGLVRTRHGVGTIVAPLDLDDLHHAIQLRIELASLIGKFAGDAAVSKATRKLLQSTPDLAELADDTDAIRFAGIDMRAHDAICALAGNPLLRRVYDEMYFRTARVRMFVLPGQTWSEEVSCLARDIELLVDALQRDDTEIIGVLVGNSIRETFARVEPLVTGRNSAASNSAKTSS